MEPSFWSLYHSLLLPLRSIFIILISWLLSLLIYCQILSVELPMYVDVSSYYCGLHFPGVRVFKKAIISVDIPFSQTFALLKV